VRSFRRYSLQPGPGPHQQQCRSNIVEATCNFVACCFDIVAVLGNNSKATFDFIEATFDFVAFDKKAGVDRVYYKSIPRIL